MAAFYGSGWKEIPIFMVSTPYRNNPSSYKFIFTSVSLIKVSITNLLVEISLSLVDDWEAAVLLLAVVAVITATVESKLDRISGDGGGGVQFDLEPEPSADN